MAISDKIKEHRTKCGLTQDYLANELHVSPQAISKWENGQTMPDINLLLPLSRILGVGVNELLGGSRRDEFDRAWKSAQVFGDELALLAAEDALREFPDDEEFLFRRANAEYELGTDKSKTGARSLSYLGQAQEHFSELHQKYPDNEKYTALLAEVLFARGNREKALDLAYSLKASSHQKSLIAKFLGGEEEIRYKQSKLEGQVKNIIKTLVDINTRESINAAHALLDVMMGEGKALRGDLLWSLYLADAELCLDGGDLEGYAEKFTKAYEAVKAYDALPREPIAYTDPLFDRLQNERNKSLDLFHFFDRFLSSEKLGHRASLELRRRIAKENVTCSRLWRHEWIAFYQFCKHHLCKNGLVCFSDLYNKDPGEVSERDSLIQKHGSCRTEECFYEQGRNKVERLVGGGKMNGFAAKIGNVIVGYCNAWDKASYDSLLVPTEYRAVEEGEKVLFFAEMQIEDNLKYCGIEAELISAALEWADNSEYTKAEVYLAEHDTARFEREVALYEKFGFRVAHDLTEDGIRRYIMQKELESSAQNSFKRFEREVMMFLAKEKPEFEAQIMAQYDKCRIKSREFTGVGFYTNFEITDPADSFGNGIIEPFGSLHVDFPGLKYGSGYVLFVKDGFITMLEGYTYGEVWPDKITGYKVAKIMQRDLKSVIDKHDPMGLLAMGCPDDEYKPEIDRLAARIRDDMTEPELSTVIYDLFLEMFSQPISKDLCDKMAKEILSQD